MATEHSGAILVSFGILVKFTQILESIWLDNPHEAAVLLVGCASFACTLFPSTQLSVNIRPIKKKHF